jgi:hypothetical protein
MSNLKSFRERQKMLAERANYTSGVEATVRRVEDTRRQRYELQESKRAPKIQVDQKVILWSWLIGIGFAFISSAIVSFNGITAVAQFVGLSQAWMAGLFFFFIELM